MPSVSFARVQLDGPTAIAQRECYRNVMVLKAIYDPKHFVIAAAGVRLRRNWQHGVTTQ